MLNSEFCKSIEERLSNCDCNSGENCCFEKLNCEVPKNIKIALYDFDQQILKKGFCCLDPHNINLTISPGYANTDFARDLLRKCGDDCDFPPTTTKFCFWKTKKSSRADCSEIGIDYEIQLTIMAVQCLSYGEAACGMDGDKCSSQTSQKSIFRFEPTHPFLSPPGDWYLYSWCPGILSEDCYCIPTGPGTACGPFVFHKKCLKKLDLGLFEGKITNYQFIRCLNYLATGDLSGETYPNSIVHIEIPCKVDTEIRENEYYIILLNMPDIGLAFIEKKPANYLFDFNFKCGNTRDYETGELLDFEFLIKGTFDAIIYDKRKYFDYIKNRCIEMLDHVSKNINLNKCHKVNYAISGTKECCAGSNRISKTCNDCCNRKHKKVSIDDVSNNIDELVINFEDENFDIMFGVDESKCIEIRRIWNLKKSSGLKLGSKIFTNSNSLINEIFKNKQDSPLCCDIGNKIDGIRNKKNFGECIYGDSEAYTSDCEAFNQLNDLLLYWTIEKELMLSRKYQYREDRPIDELKEDLLRGIDEICNFIYSNFIILSVCAFIRSDGKISIIAFPSKSEVRVVNGQTFASPSLILITEKFFDNCRELNDLEDEELNLKIEFGYILSLDNYYIYKDLRDKFIKIKFLKNKKDANKGELICNPKKTIINIGLPCEGYFFPIHYDPRVIEVCNSCSNENRLNCTHKVYPSPPTPRFEHFIPSLIYFPNFKISPPPHCFQCYSQTLGKNIPRYKSYFVVFHNLPSVLETVLVIGPYIPPNNFPDFTIVNELHGLDAANNQPIKLEIQRYQLRELGFLDPYPSVFIPVGELDINLVSEDYRIDGYTKRKVKLAERAVSAKMIVIFDGSIVFYIVDKNNKYVSFPLHYDQDLDFYGNMLLENFMGIGIDYFENNYSLCEFSQLKFKNYEEEFIGFFADLQAQYYLEGCEYEHVNYSRLESPCKIDDRYECGLINRLGVISPLIRRRYGLYLEATLYPGERFKVCEN